MNIGTLLSDAAKQGVGAAVGFGAANLVTSIFSGLGNLFRRRKKRPKPVEPGFSMTTIIKGDEPSLTSYEMTQRIFNALLNNASTSPNTQLRNAMMLQGTQSYMQAVPQIQQAAAQIALSKSQPLIESQTRALQMFGNIQLQKEQMKLEQQRLAQQNKMANAQMMLPLIMGFMNNNNNNKTA